MQAGHSTPSMELAVVFVDQRVQRVVDVQHARTMDFSQRDHHARRMPSIQPRHDDGTARSNTGTLDDIVYHPDTLTI
jgi:hypothetical protein